MSSRRGVATRVWSSNRDGESSIAQVGKAYVGYVLPHYALEINGYF